MRIVIEIEGADVTVTTQTGAVTTSTAPTATITTPPTDVAAATLAGAVDAGAAPARNSLLPGSTPAPVPTIGPTTPPVSGDGNLAAGEAPTIPIDE
jgi:hypothetical protein